jgi:hypothetical protein
MIRVLRFIISRIFKLRFKQAIQSGKFYLLCDIDNSIARTWQERKAKEFNYSNLKPLLGSITFIKELEKKSNFQILFLSARHYREYWVTKRWVGKYFNSASKIYIVRNASEKLWYINYLISKKVKFEVFDDLSYNHENGTVLYYFDIIELMKSNNIKHYNFEFIQKLNEKDS